jgi:hypothetical protein
MRDALIVGQAAQQDILRGKGATTAAPGSSLMTRRRFNYSENHYDFKICEKPDGERYGISDNESCGNGAKEAGRVKNKQNTKVENIKEVRKELLKEKNVSSEYKTAISRYANYFQKEFKIDREEAVLRGKLSADNDLFVAYKYLPDAVYSSFAKMLIDKSVSTDDCESVLEELVKGNEKIITGLKTKYGK